MAQPRDVPALEGTDLTPADPPTGAVVWLHGLGADGHDFEPLFQGQGIFPAPTRVVLPHAPRRPVTVNGGAAMRAWYDVLRPDLAAEPDMAGIAESAERIRSLIEALEADGIASGRIVLGGFSQGGVMALWTGLTYPRPLAGIAALSAYLPDDPPLAPAQRQTPIFQGHGEADSLIPRHLGEDAHDRLVRLGACPPEWHTYPMDHGVCDAEVADLYAWLARVLG